MSVVAYQFWSPICEPCKAIKPFLENLKEDFPTVEWVSINTKENGGRHYTLKFGVETVPTMVVVRDGSIIGRTTGTNMSEYFRILRQATK
jgi:thioredoxin 1